MRYASKRITARSRRASRCGSSSPSCSPIAMAIGFPTMGSGRLAKNPRTAGRSRGIVGAAIPARNGTRSSGASASRRQSTSTHQSRASAVRQCARTAGLKKKSHRTGSAHATQCSHLRCWITPRDCTRLYGLLGGFFLASIYHDTTCHDRQLTLVLGFIEVPVVSHGSLRRCRGIRTI